MSASTARGGLRTSTSVSSSGEGFTVTFTCPRAARNATRSAARRAAVGDLLIIAAFAQVPEADVATHKPQLVFVDEKNRQVELRHKVPVQTL